MADHEAEVNRVAVLMRNLAERAENEAKELGWENFRFDTVGVVGVVSWTDEDGNECEEVAMGFESKRHHVQTGILRDALVVHLQTRE